MITVSIEEIKLFKTSHRNLPLWLENNFIFRKIFIIRKLYFTNKRRYHYSAVAEDVVISKFFPKKYKGFFVDVGCYHPVKYSNTWALYKKGWRGINIDIDSIKIEMFNLARTKDINIKCAVSDKEGVVDFYKHGFLSQLSTISKSDFTKKCRVEKVESRNLTSIIDETKYKNKKIDLLTVDAEGHDLEVIKSLDVSRYQPSIIVIEINNRVFHEIEKTPMYNYLLSLDYSLVGWCGVSLIMASKERQKTLNSIFE